MRTLVCPECGRVSSVSPWCARPICVHAWMDAGVEIWDADNVDGDGRSIECSPNESYRTPGPYTWAEMVELL